MIQFKDYSVAYGDTRVLKDFNFNIKPGKTYAVVGPSGCGKTTLVYSISSLLPKTAVTSGACVNSGRYSVSTVLQDYGLFPWKTVYDNTALPLILKSRSTQSVNEKKSEKKNPENEKEDTKSRVEAVLKQVGIEGLMTRYPHALSGGQKQRVAIARALVSTPDLIVMDEPFSSVDTITREQLQEDLKKLIQESGKTLFLVTHNIEEAVFLAHQVLVLSSSGELVRVFDNPCYDLQDGREQGLFYETCIEIRKCMKGGC